MSRSSTLEPVARHPADRDHDFYTWCLEQSDHLRAARVTKLDLSALAEELSDLGVEQEHALQSSLRIVLLHLLKWQLQPARCSRSWRASIVRERGEFHDRLGRNPGLKPKLGQLLDAAYRRARREAAAETGIDEHHFPSANPFSLSEAVDDAFWPAGTPPA